MSLDSPGRQCALGRTGLRVALRLALCLVLLAPAVVRASEAAAPPVVGEEIDLSPPDKAGWTLRNVVAPVVGLFKGGPGYYYEPRRVLVQTTPPGGQLDLFYVRASFQKRFEQAEAPVTLLLPRRIDAGTRDSVTIRAFREGYRQQSVVLRMGDKQDRVVIELDPLPNTLTAFRIRYFAQRCTLSFVTEELLEFRVQEAPDGFSVVFNETARDPEAVAAMDGVRNPVVDEIFGQQLGEDLLIQVVLSERALGEVEIRSRQRYLAARELYEFSVDLVPTDGGRSAVETALDALAGIRSDDVDGCALAYDRVLHEQLDAGALNRALTPNGDFTDRYLRAAMRRLGEVAPEGAVRFRDGSVYDPTVPIELEAALSQAGGAEGFPALLRRFVEGLEPEAHRRETLRSLLAPELEPARFGEILDAAEAAEGRCRERDGQRAALP